MAVWGAGIKQVVSFAPAEFELMEVGLFPVDAVTAFRIAVTPAIQFVPAAFGIEGKVPHPKQTIRLTDYAAPCLCAFSFPRPVRGKDRFRQLVDSVH